VVHYLPGIHDGKCASRVNKYHYDQCKSKNKLSNLLTCLSKGPAGEAENNNTIFRKPSSDEPRRNENRYCHRRD